MSILQIILIAVGLAMDCFAVSITKGITAGKSLYTKALLMALLFALFQGGMPLIGFFAGIGFADTINRFDHWIALLLLGFIGGKMIVESLRKDKDNDNRQSDFSFKTLILLAVATSIDALATGIIFVPTPALIWLAVAIIAAVSFIFSIAGYAIGRQFGTRFKLNVELIGGLILIAIGLKIFIEHTC